MKDEDHRFIKEKLGQMNQAVTGGSFKPDDFTKALDEANGRIDEVHGQNKGESKPPKSGDNFKLGNSPKPVTPPASNTPSTPLDVPHPDRSGSIAANERD